MDEIWDRTLNTNLRGAFYVARAHRVRKLHRLCGSKGGMVTMAKSLARALAPDIRVNALSPGAVHTRFADWPGSMFEQARSVTLLGEIATVEDVAAVALLLCAHATSTTGENITLDGGLMQLGRTR